ncbi:MAG TPA: glycosyltransferase family 39 protein [Vicinamibacterales bacterium]|nr:glycosyltransferase family 39 protein [Vicinamibacterales bacterium]
MLRRRLTAVLGPDPPRRTLILSIVGICVLSVPVFCTRFLNDMDYYTLVSDKLLRGAVLYRNAIDTKPPLVFLHYLAIFKLFGPDSVTAVKVVTMGCLAASSLLMRNIDSALFPRAARPEVAALLFVLASFSGWGEDFLSPNTEILSNLFVLAGVLCMVKEDFSGRPARLLLAGISIGVAFLYRYQAGAALAAYFFTVVVARGHFDRPARRLVMLGIGWLIPVAAIVAYYSRIGAVHDLEFLIQYQRFYARGQEIYWPHLLGQVGIVAAGQGAFILLAGSQAIRMLRRPVGKRDLFLLLFLLFSVAPFFIGGHYFAHYIVQAIPAFVLLAAERLRPSEPSPDPPEPAFFFRHARRFIVAIVALFWMVNTAYYTSVPADPRNPNLARFVRAQTDPKDAIFIWTERSHILFEIDRVYATRFLSNEFLTGRLYGSKYRRASATADQARAASVPQLWPALLQDLRQEKPRLIVDDAPERSNFTIGHYPPLSAFVRAYYEPGQTIDGFCVYVRKSG